ncbi:MAG: radical SAM family heme chaperone HemW [Oscillospiraceae bacterium]|nr:radical SAM family heme chaperone HemW [Oscillospiraceae bacterium]
MDPRLGVYIHIPFCASKCGYCDFCSYAGSEKLMPRYHAALLGHIREAGPQLRQHHIDTVYFGGGTPSYYGARKLCEIFNCLKINALVYKTAEVTVEVNPDSVRKRDLKLLKSEGFNRVSIGAQSANDDILKLIGRRHNWDQVVRAAENAREAGFDNISLDLIYGLPSQSAEDWADTLNKALALRPEHLSCYALTLNPNTPMYEYKSSPLLPDDDAQADMYLYTVETLERFGYGQYEISNFCLKGRESRHNMKYWLLRDYMGFGAGAHSCVDGVRYSFVKDLRQYISGIHNADKYIDEYEKIEFIGLAAEYIMLGMRTVRGISEKEYHRIFKSDFEPIESALREFEQKGWAVTEGDRWRFTPNGFLLSNLLIGILLDKQAALRASGNPWMGAESLFAEHEELPAGEEIFYRSREREKQTN